MGQVDSGYMAANDHKTTEPALFLPTLSINYYCNIRL